MFNNFLCADALLVGFLVFDCVLLAAAIGLLVWFFVKNSKKTVKPVEKTKSISKLDDETYVIENPEEPVEETPVYENDNSVVHFVNQISDINEEAKTELNANTVVVNHEVEMPAKKAVVKDEIENFVVIGGEKKAKEETSKVANRGTNAFKNATNFFNTIKSEQSVPAPKNTRKTNKTQD